MHDWLVIEHFGQRTEKNPRFFFLLWFSENNLHQFIKQNNLDPSSGPMNCQCWQTHNGFFFFLNIVEIQYKKIHITARSVLSSFYQSNQS